MSVDDIFDALPDDGWEGEETGEFLSSLTDDAAREAELAEAIETAEAEAHAEAAAAAQQRADEAVAAGDYAAAAAERADAEEAAWAAGDHSMLHGSDSARLEAAADRVDAYRDHERQEAEAAAAGDYVTAREQAAEAIHDIGWADHLAGGADHSGQARAEYDKQDWAVWEEGRADDSLREADYYLAQGDFGAAESHLEDAAGHQARADEFGREGQHGAPGAVWDPSSEMAEGTPVGGEWSSGGDSGAGGYDFAAADPGYDATPSDPGYDSGAGGGHDDVVE